MLSILFRGYQVLISAVARVAVAALYYYQVWTIEVAMLIPVVHISVKPRAHSSNQVT